MRLRASSIAFLATFALVTAGCLGDDGGGVDPGPSPGDGNETGGPPGNGTGPGSGAGGGFGGSGDNNTTEGGSDGWTYDNRTGDVSGVGLMADAPQAEESFTVADGAAELALDLGVEGDSLDVEVRPPGCEEAGCATTGDASAGGGNFTFTTAAPASGSWVVVMSAGGLGPQSSSYSLSIGVRAGAGNNTTA